MYGELKAEEIEDVLKQQLVGHLGCCNNNVPYIVPICYAYDGDGIYARTYEGTKLKMMRENHTVCFQVTQMHNMINWRSVICRGEFEELSDLDKRQKGLKMLHSRVLTVIGNNTLKLSPHWPFSSIDSESSEMQGIIFCIHITAKTGSFETDKEPGFFHERNPFFGEWKRD